MNKTQAARLKVTAAIKKGILVRPSVCSKCRQPGPIASDGRATIQAHHHKGYDFPLDVVWLCVSCHHQEDKRASGEKNGWSKLDWKTVSEIRSRYQPPPKSHCGYWDGCTATPMRSLAREFGVSLATIQRVISRTYWTTNEPPKPIDQ